jgi:hypothetical protein
MPKHFIKLITSILGGAFIMLSPLTAQNLKKYTIKVRAVKDIETAVQPNGTKNKQTSTNLPGIPVKKVDLILFKGFVVSYDLVYKKIIKGDETITDVKNGKIISIHNKPYIYCDQLGKLQIIATNNKTKKKTAYQTIIRNEPVIYAGKTPEGSKIDGLSLIALPVRFDAQNGSRKFFFDTKIIKFTISYLSGNKIISYTFEGDKIPVEKRKEFDNLPKGTKVTISEIYFSYFNFETILKKNAEFIIDEISFFKL